MVRLALPGYIDAWTSWAHNNTCSIHICDCACAPPAFVSLLVDLAMSMYASCLPICRFNVAAVPVRVRRQACDFAGPAMRGSVVKTSIEGACRSSMSSTADHLDDAVKSKYRGFRSIHRGRRVVANHTHNGTAALPAKLWPQQHMHAHMRHGSSRMLLAARGDSGHRAMYPSTHECCACRPRAVRRGSGQARAVHAPSTSGGWVDFTIPLTWSFSCLPPQGLHHHLSHRARLEAARHHEGLPKGQH